MIIGEPISDSFQSIYYIVFGGRGLTKREHFAGLAMQSLIINMKDAGIRPTQEQVNAIAVLSHTYADAMCEG